jgi:hypothetical protein
MNERKQSENESISAGKVNTQTDRQRKKYKRPSELRTQRQIRTNVLELVSPIF